ncbi:MAG: hypothetical protein AAF456_05070 [Planctomycetota bacterium]
MNTIRSNPGPDEAFERVVDSIRNEQIPVYPGHFATDELKVEIPAGNATAPKRRRSGRYNIPLIAAAASLLAFACLLLLPGGSEPAFGKVLSALQEVSAMRYVVVDHHENGDLYETQVVIAEPEFSRSEQSLNGEIQGTQILNLRDNVMVEINHKSEVFIRHRINPDDSFDKRRNNFLQTLRDIETNATRYSGEVEFNGEKADEYFVDLADREFKVIVSRSSGLPVHMEYDGASDGHDGFREVFTDFEFDFAVDDSVFEAAVPEGYAVNDYNTGPAPPEAALFVVSPETGLTPLGFGSTKEQIVGFLGQPERTTTNGTIEKLHYDSMGIALSYNTDELEDDGAVGLTSIVCLSQSLNGPRVNSFRGSTGLGICIGDSVETVIEAYGEPDMTASGLICYLRRGIRFYTLDDKIGSIEVNEPLSDDLEVEVNDDGSWEIRVRQDR